MRRREERKEGRKEREGGRMEKKEIVFPLKNQRKLVCMRHQLRHQSGRRKTSERQVIY